MTVVLQSTDSGSNITGGSGAGAQDVNFNSATAATNTFTSGAAATNTIGQNMIAGTIISENTSGTTATPTTIDVDGAGTSDAATVKGAGVITLDSNTGNSAANQIETLTLEGTSAAVTFALKDANDDPTTIVITGTQNVTISHDQASAAAHTAVTDSTTGSAVTTYSINDAFSADRDLKAIDTDVIGIGVNPDGLANHAITVKDGKTIDFEVATANQIQLDIDDGATTATTTGSLNLTFSKDITSTITIDATASSILSKHLMLPLR